MRMMKRCVVQGLVLVAAYTALTADCTRAQNCSELVNITSGDVQLLVDTSISPYCLQCLDGSGMGDTDAVWFRFFPDERGGVTNSDLPSDVEVVNGVLVLLDPMGLIRPGRRGYTVNCQGGPFQYDNIELFSTTLLPPMFSPALLMVPEGNDALVFCIYNNARQLISSGSGVQWSDPNGNPAPAQGNILFIPNITRAQAGEYRCVLTSITNDTASANTTIIVQYPSTATPEGPTLVKALPRTNVTLSCGFTGVPVPNITWTRNGDPNITGVATTVTTGNRSELTVQEVTHEQDRDGVYRCTANNTIGRVSLVDFTVQVLPEPVIGLRTYPSDTFVTIQWVYQSSGSSRRTGVEMEIWRDGVRVTNRTLRPNEMTTRFGLLQPLTRYTFTVYVVTAVGRSEPVSVDFSTLSLRVPQPVITTFTALSATELLLDWQPPAITPDTTAPIISWILELSPTGGNISLVTQDNPQVTNTTFTGLQVATEYRVRVAGVNVRRVGDFSDTATAMTREMGVFTDTATAMTTEMGVLTDTATEMTNTAGNPRTNSGDGGTVVAAVVVVIILLTLSIGLVLILAILFIRKRQMSLKMSLKSDIPTGTDSNILMYHSQHMYHLDSPHHNGGVMETPCAVDRKELPSQTAAQDEASQNAIPLEEIDSAPELLDYKPKVSVCEGKQATLRVMFSGSPTPTVTWSCNGVAIVSDYATEVGSDGSLFFVCVESKHSGRYGFQVSNRAGSVEGNITLELKEAEEEVEGKEEKSEDSHPVKLDMLGEYVAEMHASNNRGFVAQFQAIPTGEVDPSSDIGKEVDNKPLNRFKNILPYNDHRIQLEPFDDRTDCQNGYINASPIDFQHPKTYIACQGPLPNTITDFWRMVWQEEVETIAMVTNLQEDLKKKCERYWPDISSEQYGPFRVTLRDTLVYANYVIRELHMECLEGEKEGESRKITHCHFTTWPDHGVPEYAGPMLSFLKKIKSKQQGPLLVHCSAGVGRTGTLISIDMALTLAPIKGTVDIPRMLTMLRRQRMKMVQTADQYIFIHDAVLKSLHFGDTQIQAGDLVKAIQKLREKDEVTQRTGYETQFQVLEQVSPKDSDVVRTTAVKFPQKNRNSRYLPPDKWRCCLQRQMPDYIHASFADGYKQRKGLVIAQAPMDTTLSDFWRLISDRGCGVVVMLSELEEEGKEVCVQYWPTEGDSMEYGQYLVTTVKVHKNKGYIQRVLNVSNPKSHELQKVVQFQLKGWTSDGTCINPDAIIEVLNHISVVQRKSSNNPILVHGSNTVSRVGVFCCLVNAIDLCKTEGSVDVFQVLKALRIQKPGSVQTVEQYSFIFDVIMLFLGSFNIYANFK